MPEKPVPPEEEDTLERTMHEQPDRHPADIAYEMDPDGFVGGGAFAMPISVLKKRFLDLPEADQERLRKNEELMAAIGINTKEE